MQELVAWDETLLWAVALVVDNLCPHPQTLHDPEKALHHSVCAKSAGEVGRGVVTSTDREEVRQEVGEAGVELPGEDDIAGHHEVHLGQPGQVVRPPVQLADPQAEAGVVQLNSRHRGGVEPGRIAAV